MGVADTRYSTHPWDGAPDGASAYTQPSSAWEIGAIADATSSLRAPSHELAERAAAIPLPGETFGQDRRALGIADVLGETRLYPTRANDFSGSPAGYSGSIRNSLGAV